MWEQALHHDLDFIAYDGMRQPLTHDAWTQTGPKLRGANKSEFRNATFPVVNQDGVYGFQKFYPLCRASDIPSVRRMVADLYAPRLAFLGDFPVAPNFLNLECQTPHPEKNSIISLAPYKNGRSLADTRGERLPIEMQKELIDFFSKMFPFYQWLQLGDFNAGNIIIDDHVQNIYSSAAAIDFEDCGISRWLEQLDKGLPLTHEDLSRQLKTAEIDKIIQEFCPDIASGANGFLNRDILMSAIADIEKANALELVHTATEIPETFYPNIDADTSMLISILDERAKLLRPMFLDSIVIQENGEFKRQQPIPAIGTVALDRAIDSGLPQTPQFRNAIEAHYRNTALEIAGAIDKRDYNRAAEIYMTEYDRIRHSNTAKQGFSALSKCLLDRNLSIFPFTFDETGEVSEIYMIHPTGVRGRNNARLFEPVKFDLKTGTRIPVDPYDAEYEIFDRIEGAIFTGFAKPENLDKLQTPHILKPAVSIDMLNFV